MNERFAAEHWPGESALGRRVRIEDSTGRGEWRTVVGVASNIVQGDPTRQAFDPVVYVPFRQSPERGMWILAKSGAPVDALRAAFREEVLALDSDLAIFLGPYTLDERLAENYWDRRLYTLLFLVFGLVAVCMASVGLYALVARAVGRRIPEFGIRMAIGATRSDIRRLVFAQGMVPVGIGLVFGLATSLGMSRFLASQLVQVPPIDPLTLIAATAALVLSAALGCFVPARRAANTDPTLAIRQD